MSSALPPYRFLSPLRYPGGKGRLAPWIASLILHNKLEGGEYIEPFAGGAGVALYLAEHQLVERVYINDADPAIYAFWHTLLHQSEAFFREVERVEINIANWNRYRSIVNNLSRHTLFEIGFATFFLNRTNVSGIIQGGPIGGKNQTGKYKLSARFNRSSLIQRMERIVSLSNRIVLSNLDALKLLEGFSPRNSKVLFYFDPPYYHKGAQLYRNHYFADDHRRISERIRALSYPWIVTYDHCPEIDELYRDCSRHDFCLNYSASLKKKSVGKETLFYDHLQIPEKPHLLRKAS